MSERRWWCAVRQHWRASECGHLDCGCGWPEVLAEMGGARMWFCHFTEAKVHGIWQCDHGSPCGWVWIVKDGGDE